jgi:hypothetical protein
MESLHQLVQAALHSPGLMPPNEINLARYSLNQQTRNRLLDPDIGALEDYLIDLCGLPEVDGSSALLHEFGDVVYQLCQDEPLFLSYQNMAWLLAWLNIRHLPSFFGEDPDSPLQVLQMAAALGLGEWAALHLQIEEGVGQLLNSAESPLWRVREAAALGLARLLARQWTLTLRRFRQHCLMATPYQWRAMVGSVIVAEGVDEVLDALALLQDSLHYLRRMDAARRERPDAEALGSLLNSLIAEVASKQPTLGLAQMEVWALWPDGGTKAILRANLPHLPPEDAAKIEARLD